MHALLRFSALLLGLVLFASCGGGGDGDPTRPAPAPAPAPVASVAVTLAASQVEVGGSTTAVAEPRSATGSALGGRAIAWSSSNAAVATVSSAGVVTALAPGTTSIAATSEGQTGSATLTVIPVPVASVTVVLAQETVVAGTGTSATATVRSASGEALSGRAIAWTSSNTNVANVSSTGVITTVAPGTVIITATSEGRSGTATLTVSPRPVASVMVALGQASVTAGTPTSAIATLRAANGDVLTGRAISWTSSNASVANVTDAGVITTLTPGTTTITANSEGQSGSATLTVTPRPVAAVTVTLTQASVIAGTPTSATAIVLADNGEVLTGRAVNWSSSSPAVATVNGTGLITTSAPGSTTITATSEGRSGSALLTVTAPPVASVAVTLGAQTLRVGQTTSAQAVPRDASGNALAGRSVVWSSSNASVALVSQTGVVSAVAPGNAELRATVEGRVGSAYLQVTTTAVASVTLTPSTITMLAGDQRLIVATVRDASGTILTGRNVQWFSSNTTVVDGATSGDSAVITGLRAGTAVISVDVEGRTASTTVLVQVPTTNVCTQIAGASIIGHDGRFLGRFTNRFDNESVLNEFGPFGSRFASNSTNNEFGTYGSPFNSLSARNRFTSTPPRIIRNGVFLAFYTVNETLTPRVAPDFALTCNFP